MGGGTTGGTVAARMRSAQFPTLWRAAERGSGAIDVADDTVREHVVAVADVIQGGDSRK
jgi:hypothetical protein